MADLWIHEFTVDGAWGFPADMLRYDRCSPSTSDDVDKVIPHPDRGQSQEVKLIAYNTKNWQPTRDRWSSFGWRVLTHTKRRFN